MKVCVEIFACVHEGEDRIRYHHLRRDITRCQCDPDEAVSRALSGLGAGEETRALQLSHSTSWRYEAEKALVLTYMAWVAPGVLAGLPTRCLRPSGVAPPVSAGPLAPRPDAVREEQVLAHGLRHLGFLLHKGEDPNVRAVLGTPELMAFFQTLTPAVAGRFESTV